MTPPSVVGIPTPDWCISSEAPRTQELAGIDRGQRPRTPHPGQVPPRAGQHPCPPDPPRRDHLATAPARRAVAGHRAAPAAGTAQPRLTYRPYPVQPSRKTPRHSRNLPHRRDSRHHPLPRHRQHTPGRPLRTKTRPVRPLLADPGQMGAIRRDSSHDVEGQFRGDGPMTVRGTGDDGITRDVVCHDAQHSRRGRLPRGLPATAGSSPVPVCVAPPSKCRGRRRRPRPRPVPARPGPARKNRKGHGAPP